MEVIMSTLASPELAARVPLVGRVESVRHDSFRFMMVRAALWLFLGLLIACGVLALADWNWVFAPALRVAVWLLLGSAAAIGCCRKLLIPRPLDPGDTAADIEKAFPELGQRVCTTLDYAEPTPRAMPAWPSLVHALMSDTEQRTAGLAFDRVVPWRTLLRPGSVVAALVSAFAVLLLVSPEARIAAMRLFLIPVDYTQFEIEPGDHTVRLGADFTVRAVLSGRPVDSLDLVYRKAESENEWTSVSFSPHEDEDTGDTPRLSGILETTLKDCRDNVDYRVVAGRLESPIYRLTVVHPLILQKIEADIEPPAYTRQKSSVATEGDFRVIEGSGVQFRFTLDRPVRTAELRFFVTAPEAGKSPAEGQAPSQSMPLPPVPLDIQENVLTGKLSKVSKPVEYELQAETADGMRLEPRRFHIQVQFDQKPTISFIKPKSEIEVTPTTEVTMQVQAGDDFGLSQVGIVYQIGSGPKKTLRLEKHPKQPVSLTTLATLYLEDYLLTQQDSVTYYAFAEDNDPAGPHRVTTELQFIDIRPYKLEYQVSKGGGAGCGCSGSLEELIRRQRSNLQRSFAQCEESRPDTQTVERIAKAERALAEATAEFAAKLAAQSAPVPCLENAAKAMESATAELDQSHLKPACAQEEISLAELIKARQNLRKLLSQSSSASQCQQVDNQQQQKMRAAEQPKSHAPQKQPDSDVQQEIEKLAKTERQCSQQIESQCNSGQSQSAASGKPGQSARQSQGPRNPSPQAGHQDLAERQEQAVQQAAELGRKMRENEAMTDLARQRMARAGQTIQQSAQGLRSGQEREAGQQAKDAAEQLESLARQVAGLTCPEMAGKLTAAEGLARRLAREQRARQLQSKSENRERSAESPERAEENTSSEQAGGRDQQSSRGSPAECQRWAAGDARTLGDFLQQFQKDASDSDAKLARALRDAAERNPPAEIAEQMERVAEAMQSGRRDQEQREIRQTAEHLDALAQQLGAVRREFVQPQLEKLLAAEKRAAELQKQISTLMDEQQRAEAEQKMGELQASLGPLRPADERIAEEAQKLDEIVHDRGGWSQWHEIRTGFYKPSELAVVEIRRLSKALQVRIQEIILKDAFLDQDEPVPPQYRKRVESYYRVLSEDLR